LARATSALELGFWKPDAMVETQTANAAFRDSSDVLRLNDIWYATRDAVGTMRERARIARISGWELVEGMLL